MGMPTMIIFDCFTLEVVLLPVGKGFKIAKRSFAEFDKFTMTKFTRLVEFLQMRNNMIRSIMSMHIVGKSSNVVMDLPLEIVRFELITVLGIMVEFVTCMFDVAESSVLKMNSLDFVVNTTNRLLEIMVERGFDKIGFIFNVDSGSPHERFVLHVI